MNNLQAVFQPYEDAWREKVYVDTWGHLAPDPHAIYTGHIIIARSTFAHTGTVVLQWEFKTEKDVFLDSSPWFYRDIHDHAHKVTEKAPGDPDSGYGIWVWRGTFRLLKNGGSRWSGKLSSQRIQDRFKGHKK